MSPLTWQTLNLKDIPAPSSVEGGFTITTSPKTDLWRPDPQHDTHTAPAIYTAIQACDFKRATLTVYYDNFKTLYDQGGLYINFPASTSSDDTNTTHEDWARWLKAGVEVTHGAPHLSSVGTDKYSDWAVSPIDDTAGGKVTIEAVREDDGLWIYATLPDGGRRQPLRQCTWALVEELQRPGAVMWIGATAAKPTPEEGDPGRELVVRFEGLGVELKSTE